ncbi:hypothetical protein [Planomonospora venezuelensis]|uniref:EF-hand domain-containing protein n=1 Tax=Planomonospora venezuelensis TaxID=1999 RepID=A0A841D1E3_PLAVE|nr:hypothetical protein [Planomonospora venezuelensis]MBB5964482.1 hypothetical protein [Planomonospora venezuelensis]GIN04217.1 hypothetical protein Pve01_58750 [Planomonospora venezuelensis]
MTTGPEFTGVRQAEFDAMAGEHTQAAGRLEQLAQALYGELQGAGLDTSPAVRLRELAGRVTAQAEDLRRRQKLVHELDRRKVAFGVSTPAGSFLKVPDTLEAARGLLDGTLAGRAALKGADGDARALAELEKYASRTGDAEFAKVFLSVLGAGGVTRLPGSLAVRLREAASRGDSDRVARLSASGKQALRMLSTALAKGTDPKNPAYMGAGFLRSLAKEGRKEHKAGDTKYAGYQAQALIWRAHDGKTPFSKEFMEVVGRDAVVYEQERYKSRWAASKDLLGRTFAGDQIPMFDLASSLGLGGLLRPGTHAGGPGAQTRSSVVDDLFHAASFGKDASQALLNHTPAGWKESVLDYMLTTRWNAFRYLDDYKPFNDVLIAATTGQDTTSQKLASEMTKILADEVRPAFAKGDDGNLSIKDRAAFDRFTPLGYPLARALAANIDQFSRLLLNHATFGKASAEDLSYALTLATANDAGFEALVRAQTEHMRAALDTVPPVGLTAANAEKLGFTKSDVKKFDFDEDGRVDKADIKQFLTDRTVAEARPFGHIVEIRHQTLIAQGLDGKKASDALKNMVRDGIGLFPVPGSRQLGEQVGQAFSGLVTSAYDKLTGFGYDALSKQIGQQAATQGRSMDEAHRTLGDNRVAVERLAEQMIATAMLNKGMLDEFALKDQSFAMGTPPRLKPFTEMTPQEYSQFLEWARVTGGSDDLMDRFHNTFRRTSHVDDYLDLQIPSSPAGDK